MSRLSGVRFNQYRIYSQHMLEANTINHIIVGKMQKKVMHNYQTGLFFIIPAATFIPQNLFQGTDGILDTFHSWMDLQGISEGFQRGAMFF